MISRDKALHLDGMIYGCAFHLNSIVDIIKVYVHPDQRRTMIHCIGRAMGELLEMHNMIYDKYPDVKPEEVKSPRDAEIEVFRHAILIQWDEPKRNFVATTPDFPEIEAVAWTQLDAMKSLQRNIEDKLKARSSDA